MEMYRLVDFKLQVAFGAVFVKMSEGRPCLKAPKIRTVGYSALEIIRFDSFSNTRRKTHRKLEVFPSSF